MAQGIRLVVSSAMTFIALSACSGGKKGGDDGGGGGRIEQEFYLSAAESGIPARMMMAAGYLESGLAADASSAMYIAPRTMRLTQSAFGLPLSDLKLDTDKDSKDLAHQINHYAAYLKEQITDVSLSRTPQTDDDKVRWALALADVHRKVSFGRHNLQAIYAREIINILNTGFTWQDPDTGEVLNFPKENPAIRIADLPKGTLSNLRIDPIQSYVESATFIQVGHSNLPNNNTKKRIEVTHCPLSLSACMALQDNSGDEIRMGAHYLVQQITDPADAIINRDNQVHNNNDVVEVTDADGKTRQVTDAIVVMLVGFSGHYVDGVRTRAIPTWLSEQQLSRMGALIHDLCVTAIAIKDEGLQQKCMSDDNDLGVRFRNQGSSRAFQWGDIVDFEPAIYYAYTQGNDIQGGMVIDFTNPVHQFQAGQQIDYFTTFDSSTRLTEVRRLLRCPDNRLVWHVEDSEQVPPGVTRFDLHFKGMYDAGPNGNGEQFLRVMGSGPKGELTGWATVSMNVLNYDKTGNYAAPSSACR